ncbi:MAG: hypothetical protein Q7S27_03835 [Nanoarchaeota archaeon]|nr:hypothetical protein [Nanoarchaeota archaeon]
MEKVGQELSRKWYLSGNSLSFEQKDKIGVSYLINILGVDEKTVQDFLKTIPGSYNEIGLRQSGLIKRKEDYKKFWEEVSQISPQFHTAENLEWLITKKDIFSVWHFMHQIADNPPNITSSNLARIRINAHVYK